MDPQEFWVLLFILAVSCITFLSRGIGKIRQARRLENMPTSRVRSAHQGFVELEGVCRSGEKGQLTAPLSGAACVWYAYRIERKEDKNWRTVKQEVSDAPFLLDDGTGVVTIVPRGAKVLVEDSHTWYGGRDRLFSTTLAFALGGGRYRYTEKRIEADDRLIVQGEFRSRHFDAPAADPEDADSAAAGDPLPLSQHEIFQPGDRHLPFLVSNVKQTVLTARLRRGGWISLGLFMLTGGLVVYMMTSR